MKESATDLEIVVSQDIVATEGGTDLTLRHVRF